MNETHVIDLIPAYALGALEDAERAEVARHLDQCAECQAELRAYQAVVNSLALTAQERTPPARLRQSILERVEPKPTMEQRAPSGAEVRIPWHRRWLPQGRAWAPVAIGLIVLLLISNLVLWTRLQQVQHAQAQVAQEFSLAELTGAGPAASADGVLIYQPENGNAILVVEGMPQLPADRQYQLWLIQDDQRTSGGVFTVKQNGYGVLQVQHPKPLRLYDSFGVTIEPAGGSPQPSGQRVLSGSF